MAHFAELTEENIVSRVVVVSNEELLLDGVENEAKGIEFLETLFGHGRWKQTSYHGAIRKNFAGIGYAYDPERDWFVAPRPYPSWVLDEQTGRWAAPVLPPQDDGTYVWEEQLQQWKKVQ